MPNEPLAQPTFKPIKQFRPLRLLERLHPARRHVVLNCVMATSKLPRDPLQPPPARPQPQHLRHIVRHDGRQAYPRTDINVAQQHRKIEEMTDEELAARIAELEEEAAVY